MEGLLYLLFLAWVVLAGMPRIRGAVETGRLAGWSVVTLTMIALPAGIIIGLVSIDEAGVAGMPLIVSTMVAGGSLFALAAVAKTLGDLAALIVRLVGWSMLIAPMLLSWVLFALIPIPLLLAFVVHPIWDDFRFAIQKQTT